MKLYLATLGIVLLAGIGSSVRAQGPVPASQQPEEIPAQYPQQYPQQYPPYPQYPAPPQAAQQPGTPQQPGVPQQPAQPQGQNALAAARIGFVQGDVTTQRADTGEWVTATVNTPVVVGDKVATGANSRAEIQFDNANILRLADNSETNIANFTPSLIQLQVGRGLVTLNVLNGSQADVEIDTPNASIHPQLGEGSYRITVNSDSETIVDIRKGAADISTPEGSTQVENNQRITVEGVENAQYQIAAAAPNDDWDKWNNDRDQMIETAASWQHTNPNYVGTQDLDTYGQWESVPDYGSVWVPAAGPGWAPYRDGRWVFEPYYGWTWVSYEPWGWAPYHYGRWFVYGANWVWWPGPVYAGYRPVWAPAYVSFIGFGGGVSVGVGFGFGSVGWLPIGPGDYFHPWYGRGVTRVDAVNLANVRAPGVGGIAPLRGGPNGISNLDRAVLDEHVRSGFSSMSANQFGNARVPMQQARIDATAFRQGSVMTGAVPVVPTRASMRPSNQAVNPGSIPSRSVTQERFFTGGARSSQDAGFTRGGNSAGQYRQNSRPTAAGPGFQRFGGAGNTSRGTSTSPQRPAATLNQQGSRYGNYVPPSESRTAPSERTYQDPPRGSQSGYQRESPAPRQAQPYSHGSYGSTEGRRPALQMQQPIVTPRSRGNSSSRGARGESSRGGKGR